MPVADRSSYAILQRSPDGYSAAADAKVLPLTSPYTPGALGYFGSGGVQVTLSVSGYLIRVSG
jgi:hypothetical protein